MGRAEKLKEQRKIEKVRSQLAKEKKFRLTGFVALGLTIGALAGTGLFFGVRYIKDTYFPTKVETKSYKTVDKQYSQEPDMQIDTDKTYVAKFETDTGNFEISLNAKEAPKTVNNFVVLSRDGFYDGMTFHRIIKDFMIQGGDPEGTGGGGPGYTIPAEIGLKHVKGAIAMARLSDEANPNKDSSGSQFFIDLADQPSLDEGGYTVFGNVISGIDIVEKIGDTPVVNNGQGEQSKPATAVIINKVTIEEK